MEPQFPFGSIAELLHARAEDDAIALLSGDEAWTWREFVAEARIRAAVLRQLRRPGPWHVGVLMDNDPEYLFLIAGAALCGATVIGVNPTRRGAELAGDIAGPACRTLIVGAAHRDLLTDLDLDDVEVLAADGAAYRNLLDTPPVDAVAPAGAEHTLLLLFTSGSTGAPKAVVCTSARLAVIAQLNVHNLTADDVAYSAMPLFHGNALMGAWAPILAVGGTLAIRPRFSASGFLPDVQRFGATFFNYVGRSLSYVLAQPEVPGETDNRLRFGFGTEASTRDRHEFERRFGCPIVESYGSSEGVCNIVRTADTPDGALGAPAETTGFEICAPDGSACPAAVFDADGRMLNVAAAIGEIVVRGGRFRFEGYYRNPEATERKLRGDDFWTGDLAYRDTGGYYWFAGRTADWIRVDSENFATAPIERILARFPATITAIVYGIPDPRTGDRVMATLLLEPGTTFDPDALTTFLAAQPDLGTKWRPRLVRIAIELPLTATRKVDKQALRRQAWECTDALYTWDGTTYRPFTGTERTALVAEFTDHGRRELLPGTAAFASKADR